MRIAYIAAGAAGMYCGSCLHDNTLARVLMQRGHEVALIPTYTPLRTDEEDVSNVPIFYGAINVYLQQKADLFRRSPRLVDRLLDRPALLRWVSRFAASTNARDLGELTLSILEAERGRQQKELERLLAFLDSYQPDLVQLTNAMFLGIGAAVRDHLGVPVVSGLTGEDLFIGELPQPHREAVETEMRARAQKIDAFIATSRYYAEAMSDLLQVPPHRMHVAPLGIRIEGFRPTSTDRRPEDPITIGYLARICPEKGLHHLVEAFRLLSSGASGERLRLRIAGYLGGRDHDYLAAQRRAISKWGLTDAVDILGEVDRDQKLAFLHSLDLFSVPTVYKEPKGLFLLEAWAAGVPVVQPRHGAFPELIEATGGGLLVEPESPSELAAALQALIDDPERRRSLGQTARSGIEERFTDVVMAERTESIYRSVLEATAPNRSETGARS